jgi:magnesium transporter
MTLSFAAVREDWSIAEALEHLRAQRVEPDAAAAIYVTDRDGRLIDTLDIARVALSNPDARIRHIMDGIYVSITPDEDREQAARLMQKHDLVALPVVDRAGTLVGVVSVDDAMDVAEEETTEDIQRQAGIEPLRAAYPDVAARSLFRKRLPWLAALIFVYLGASGVISAFEEALAAELVLAAFIPLLMGSGGNVGAQSGTLIVRFARWPSGISRAGDGHRRCRKSWWWGSASGSPSDCWPGSWATSAAGGASASWSPRR